MRIKTLLITGLLGCTSAQAQVSFDPRALNQLQQPSGGAAAPSAEGSGAAATSPAAPRAAAPSTPAQRNATGAGQTPAERRNSRTPPAHARPAPGKREPAANAEKATPAKAAPEKPAAASTAKPAQPPAPPPDSRRVPVPTTPPPVLVLPPTIAVPVRPAPPPSPATITKDAAGDVSKLSNGARLTFGPDSTDLNSQTDAAIKTLMHAAPPFDTTTFTIAAYAAGTPEDPSTARRLALSRALAVRSVLIAEGVASVRIYVKALGANGAGFADGPPDRVDLTVATPPPASQQKLP